MLPTLEAGDWLLVDPTTRSWPRRGAIVVIREPGSSLLVVKRVVARPGDTVLTPWGPRLLGAREAWVLGDARDLSVDSRAYGPVPVSALVGRAWLRYGPAQRPIGRLGREPEQVRRR